MAPERLGLLSSRSVLEGLNRLRHWTKKKLVTLQFVEVLALEQPKLYICRKNLSTSYSSQYFIYFANMKWKVTSPCDKGWNNKKMAQISRILLWTFTSHTKAIQYICLGICSVKRTFFSLGFFWSIKWEH